MTATDAQAPSREIAVKSATGAGEGDERTISQCLAAAGVEHRRDERSRGPYSHSLYRRGAFLGSFTAIQAIRALNAGELS